MDGVIAFRDALQSVYGALDWLPVADGAIHRFHVPSDKPGTHNGWYVLYLDGIASGAFGSWKGGDSFRWCSREPLDHREAEQLRQRIEQARRQREAEQHLRQQNAARRACRMWDCAHRASADHPYLARKRVGQLDLRQRAGELLVPLHSVGGELVNLQRIAPDGSKRFLWGAQVTGSFYLTMHPDLPTRPEMDGAIYVCEGWATGATLFEQFEGVAGVACAMNAANLKPVAMALRKRYPPLKIVIAGDDDRLTEGNPGRTAANAAAVAAGSMVAFPDWPDEAPDHLSDFNDLHCWLASQEAP